MSSRQAFEQTPYEAFLSRVRAYATQRPQGRSPHLYELLKGEFIRVCPAATPAQYTRAMQLAARAAGV